MKRLGLCVVLMLSCSCHQSTGDSHVVCEQAKMSRLMEAYLRPGEPYTQGRLDPAYGFEFRGPMTIEQLILEEVKRSERKDVQLTRSDSIDAINDWWLRRRGLQYEPGDEFYSFRTDQLSWDRLVGSEGYLLLRKGKIMDVVVTVAQ